MPPLLDIIERWADQHAIAIAIDENNVDIETSDYLVSATAIETYVFDLCIQIQNEDHANALSTIRRLRHTMHCFVDELVLCAMVETCTLAECTEYVKGIITAMERAVSYAPTFPRICTIVGHCLILRVIAEFARSKEAVDT